MICRPSRSLRPVHGRSRAPRAAGVIRPASSSPSRSRNSQRYQSPVTCMKVAARAGSQICSTPSQVSRPVSALMSTTSQRSVKPRSSMVIPASCRIVLLAPSQPSTTGPVNVCVSPATRACTRTGATPTGPWVPSSPVTSAPRRKSISGCRSIRASISSSRSGWWNMFACGNPCSLAWWPRLNSAITRWLASSRRSPLPGRDRARKPSLTPIRSRVRATSSSRCTARGSGWGWVWRSSRVTGIPKSASRRAAVQPAGPAPTTMTGSWVSRGSGRSWSCPFLRVTSRWSGRRATARSGR